MINRTRRLLLASLLAAALAMAPYAAPEPAVAGSSPSVQTDLPVVTMRIGVEAAGVGLAALPLDAAPYIKNGRTMAPIRFTAESFGAVVDWSPERPLEVIITNGSSRIQLTRGSATAYVNGRAVPLDAPPELTGGRTFVPIRFVAESLAAKVQWEPDSRSVVISQLGREPGLEDLERYAVQLINLDRLVNSLEPVAWDATAAAAGRAHAEEMAQSGYFSHWNLAGQLPSFRYTQADGVDRVAENLAKIWFEGTGSYPQPDFLRVVAHESGLMESPGHRRNILDPAHTHVGVGLAQGPNGSTLMAQEFVNRYGSFSALPRESAAGQPFPVAGTLDEGVQFYGISLGRAEVKPMTVEQLNGTGAYSEPSPFISYFPKGYVTPVPVSVTGQQFSVNLKAEHLQQPGTYYVYVWATLGANTEPFLVSTRTVVVR